MSLIIFSILFLSLPLRLSSRALRAASLASFPFRALAIILVAIFFLGQQVYEGIFLQDNVSNMAHILGGIIGAYLGFLLNKKSMDIG